MLGVSGFGLTAREVCELLVLDVIELSEERELGVRETVREVVRRSVADGRPLDRTAALSAVVFIRRARDEWGLFAWEAGEALYLEALSEA